MPTCSRIVCLITGFLWDQESSILAAARALKAREILVGSAASEAAHRSATAQLLSHQIEQLC
jgi:hypothetical protein